MRINRPTHSHGSRQPLTLSGRYLPLLLGLGIAAYTIFHAVILRYPGGAGDYWSDLTVWQHAREGTLTWSHLLAPHSSIHRLLLPRLAFLAEMHLTQGSNLTLLLITAASQLTLATICLRAIRDSSLSTLSRRLAAGSVIACLFSSSLLGNAMHTFLIQWNLAAAFALLAAYTLICHEQRGTRRELVAVILCLIAATYSVFCLPALAAMLISLMIALRARRRTIAVISLSLAALTWGYWPESGVTPGPDIAAIPLVNYLLAILVYSLTYLSSPFSHLYGDPALWGTLFLALLTIGAMSTFLVQRHRRKPLRLLALACLIFAITMAISTGIGRFGSIPGAKGYRFQPIALLFWVGAVLWWLSAHSRLGRGFGQLLSVTVLLALLPLQPYFVQRFMDDYHRYLQSKLVLAVGIPDPAFDHEAINPALWPEDHARHSRYRAFLKEHHLDVFSLPESHWSGQPLPTHARCLKTTITQKRWMNSGAGGVLQGQISTLPYTQRFHLFWLVDARNIITGLAQIRRDNRQAYPGVQHRQLTWMGAVYHPGRSTTRYRLCHTERGLPE